MTTIRRVRDAFPQSRPASLPDSPPWREKSTSSAVAVVIAWSTVSWEALGQTGAGLTSEREIESR